MTTNKRFLLARRPDGFPIAEDFKLVEESIPQADPGSFVVRNHFISLDPAQRLWMDEDAPTSLPPIRLGDPVRASTIGVVHESKSPEFAVGDWVLGMTAIEDYSVVEPGGFTMKVDVTDVPSPTYFLSALGAIGLTAYFGLLVEGEPKAGDTLLVSGAAGAVGSAAGQIGKIKGCRVIGIAGGPEKGRRLIEDYGFDAAIDYRGKSISQLAEDIRAEAPDGINIIFDNVGGQILDAALLNLARHARVVISGLIAEYNDPALINTHAFRDILEMNATVRGFGVANYVDQFADAGAVMAKWIAEGRLRNDEDIQEGIENTHEIFMRLFSGANTGKLILKLV